MAKKKRPEDTSKNKAKDTSAERLREGVLKVPTLKVPPLKVPPLKVPTLKVPPLKLKVTGISGIKLSADALRYAFPSTGIISGSIPRVVLPAVDIWTTVSREQELENEISGLRKQISELLKEITAKREAEKRSEELEKIIEELKRKQRLQHLLGKVNDTARKKLLDSEEFRSLFEKSESCDAVIMAVDIRRSTELMLKARKPDLYADFITTLCAELTAIILDNCGVFDKFTGDGILAFFPDFYSGEGAPYLAIKAADECHNCFSKHYQAKRTCFKSIILDVGLGIGIDYGESHLVRIQDGLTVMGEPVVYACRMSGAKAGQTLLNQPAYEVTSRKFGEYINFQETDIDIKHEGRTLAYVATLSKKTYEPKLPDWLELPASSKS